MNSCLKTNRSKPLPGLRILGWTLILGVLGWTQSGCSNPNQSLLLYRLPYEDGTQISVWQDHLTHSPPNRLDLHGVNGQAPYRVVAAETGIIRFIEDGNTENCCGGSCGNNYVWIEHIGGEWSKYSHLETGSASNDAGLSVGDIVVAGTFLGYESNVGRACGIHLHFEVAVPDDPANPLVPGNGGFIDGINRIPRFCGVSGQIVEQGDLLTATRCDTILSCIRSVESPSTVGNCFDGLSGEVCVQEINNVALTSTYTRGIDFTSSSLKIDLHWCPNATCDENLSTGRAIHVIVQRDIPNSDPLVFIANCQNRHVLETVHNVEEIVIQEAPNLSDENVMCGGNTANAAFARWEICEVPSTFAE